MIVQEAEMTDNNLEDQRTFTSAEDRGNRDIPKAHSALTNHGSHSTSQQVASTRHATPVTDSFGESYRYATSRGSNAVHGQMYQLKLLMLFLWRGLQKPGYSFRLATEMRNADKFDDLVFQYKVEGERETFYRFLQAKHKQGRITKISASDLLTEKGDGDFSLQKYFRSYLKIMRDTEFNGSTLKDFIICTNIDFHPDIFESTEIQIEKVNEPDDFLDFGNVQQSTRWQFVINPQLQKLLKRSADLHKLAQDLVECIWESKDISLKNEVFGCYRIALAEEVIDIKNRKLSDKFIQNHSQLSKRGKKFRELVGIEYSDRYKKEMGKTPSVHDIWNKLIPNKPLKLCPDFCITSNTPTLTNLQEFYEELVKLIKDADNDYLIKVDGVKYAINAKEGSSERVFVDNIKMLAGHVLTMIDGKIKFCSNFLNNDKLPGNLGDLKNLLKNLLEEKSEIIKKYHFEMPKYFETIIKDLPRDFKKKLPEDKVKDADIEKFLTRLIFAVNQPNEIELGNMITREISADNRFNLLNSKLVGALFQKKILDWFKTESGGERKERTYYRKDMVQKFFDSTERRMNSLMHLKLSSIYYAEELTVYDVEFENENQVLKAFLTSDARGHRTESSALNLIAAHNTLPTAIRVQQAIQRSGRYKENGSLMFLHLRTSLSPDIMERVTRAFESPNSHYLLVIDCESATKQELQKLYSQLREAMSGMMAKDKKLILITRDSQPLFNLQSELLENCERIYDDVSFSDLTTDSQLELMRKGVIRFQGFHQRTSFEKLLDISGRDDTIMQDLGGAIDAGTLVKLIRHEEIKLGSDIQKFEMIKPYYIPRTIQKIVIIKEDVFNSQSGSDVIVVSTEEDDVPTSCKIVLKRDREAEEFGELCEKESGKNVHWLKYVLGKFIWHRSQGDISFLVKYRDVSENQRSDAYEIHKEASISLTENQLADHDDGEKVVIISDSAGMGKSTMLTYLARKIQERKPGHWVIRIDVNDFTEELGKELRDTQLRGQGSDAGGADTAVKFLVEKLSGLETKLDQKVLEMMMKNPSKVILLFDGFDEISPDYTEMAIALLKGLGKIGAAKLFVATRPHMRALLEDKFGTFSHTMELFSEKDQIDFLIRFWKAKLRLDDVEDQIEQRLKTYAEKLVKVVESIGATAKGGVFSVPGQLWIIAELFQKTYEGYLGSENDEPDASIILRPIELYRTFVNRKFYMYNTGKKEHDPTNLGARKDSEALLKKCHHNHQKLALHTLFNVKSSDTSSGMSAHPYLLKPEEIKDVNAYMTEIIKGQEGNGIINVVNEKAQFIHRTFAEYFAATFIFDTLLKKADRDSEVRQFFVQDILLQPQYKVIRAFLNGLLAEVSQQPADRAVNKAWEVDFDKYKYQSDTIFHVAAREGHYVIMKFFLNRIDEYEIRKALISVLVDDDCRTVLRIVTDDKQWDEIMWLIENEGAEVNSSIGNGCTVLHAAASGDNLEIVKWLVEQGALVDALDEDGMTPLHEVARSGRLDILKWLVENKNVDVNRRYENGVTLLHCAASSGETPLVGWLIKKKGADVEAVNKEGETVLVYAARFKCWNVVRHLVDLYHANINVASESGSTVLSYAVEHDNVHTVEWLVKKKSISVGETYANGRSILHHAIEAGSINVVKWLVEGEYADPNETNNEGVTPLAQALKYDRMEIFEWLVDYADFDVNAKDKHGMTSLHVAAKLRSGIIHLLVHEYGADIHALDNDDRRPVDLYVDPKGPYYELLKFGPV